MLYLPPFEPGTELPIGSVVFWFSGALPHVGFLANTYIINSDDYLYVFDWPNAFQTRNQIRYTDGQSRKIGAFSPEAREISAFGTIRPERGEVGDEPIARILVERACYILAETSRSLEGRSLRELTDDVYAGGIRDLPWDYRDGAKYPFRGNCTGFVECLFHLAEADIVTDGSPNTGFIDNDLPPLTEEELLQFLRVSTPDQGAHGASPRPPSAVYRPLLPTYQYHAFKEGCYPLKPLKKHCSYS